MKTLARIQTMVLAASSFAAETVVTALYTWFYTTERGYVAPLLSRHRDQLDPNTYAMAIETIVRLPNPLSIFALGVTFGTLAAGSMIFEHFMLPQQLDVYPQVTGDMQMEPLANIQETGNMPE